MNLRPLGEYILIKVISDEEITSSGIIIPKTVVSQPMTATVLAVGDGCIPGDKLDIRIVPGDTVVYHWGCGQEIKDGDEVLYMIRYADIVAKLTPQDSDEVNYPVIIVINSSIYNNYISEIRLPDGTTTVRSDNTIDLSTLIPYVNKEVCVVVEGRDDLFDSGVKPGIHVLSYCDKDKLKFD